MRDERGPDRPDRSEIDGIRGVSNRFERFRRLPTPPYRRNDFRRQRPCRNRHEAPEICKILEVHASIDVDRPSDVVFDFIADMANNPSWQRGMQECRWTSEPPLRLGSTYDQEAKFLGKAIVSSFEVIEFEKGQRIRIRTTGGSMPIDVTREVVPRGAGSQVKAIVRGDSSGLFRLAAPFMKLLVGSNVRADYRRLKELLEVQA
jgi:uncharacterized membrane protein